jgi:hypothetical protein
MVNVVMKMGAGGRERMQEADFNEGRRVVRVLPRSDEIRKYLKHPATRVGFLAEGTAEWPNDAFTKRRIRDGDVSVAVVEAVPEAVAEQKKIAGKKPE